MAQTCGRTVGSIGRCVHYLSLCKHVAQGHGLVWNVGGPPTEGFTNLSLCYCSFRRSGSVWIHYGSFVSQHAVRAGRSISALHLTRRYFAMPWCLESVRDRLAYVACDSAHSMHGMETMLFRSC